MITNISCKSKSNLSTYNVDCDFHQIENVNTETLFNNIGMSDLSNYSNWSSTDTIIWEITTNPSNGIDLYVESFLIQKNIIEYDLWEPQEMRKSIIYSKKSEITIPNLHYQSLCPFKSGRTSYFYLIYVGEELKFSLFSRFGIRRINDGALRNVEGLYELNQIISN